MMARAILLLILGGALFCATATPSSAVDFGIDPNAHWLGFMNVFELPQNGGGYVFGSGWGTADLTANFTNNNTVLTLGPNSVNDPSAFWYTPMGQPGATGNKIMDANFYQETTGVYTGQTIHFSGTVLTNTMVAPYTQIAFIKDFAADYSTWVQSTVALTPGPFSISLDTINDPARHIQFGFTVNGPDVWITDTAPIGTVTLAVPTAGVAGDYNGNGVVDAADYTTWRDHLGQTFALPNRDPSNSGAVNAQDYTYWKSHFGGSGAGALGVGAVPEPATWLLGLTALCGLFAIRGRRS
jgi:hypothetical protein